MSFLSPDWLHELIRAYGFWVLFAAIATGIIYFRHHEAELKRRAEAAIPGPWSQ